MKKNYLQLVVLCLFISLASFGQNLENPGEYMDAIGAQRENISKKFLSYISAANHGKRARKVENLRMKLLNEVQEARMNISGLPSFKGDKALRDTTVNFLKMYYNILNEDYSKIINLEDIAEQSYDDMQAYIMAKDMVDKKLEEGNAKMKEANEKFAAANNIRLVEGKSDLSEMTQQVHEMNKYYNEVYLIFFKPFKQESYMMEAIGKGNVTGMEQFKNAMLKYANDGLEKIASLKAFQGDNSILFSCKAMLSFYVREAEKHMSGITDYFLAKERFEGIQKEYKKKSKPSNQEIDDYNKAVNEVNKAGQNYNNTINQVNQERTELFKAWNKSVDDFLSEHTPKYR